MLINEIRAMTDDQLLEEVNSRYRELMNLRFQAATNQITDTNMPRKTRRDIAQINTVIRERREIRN
ncbi:MAG: 50S ribosomal protein L29 [Chloroflexota bacterium]|nr:50S ribosomal protein L29 [Chloroflexota bacterium]